MNDFEKIYSDAEELADIIANKWDYHDEEVISKLIRCDPDIAEICESPREEA